VGSTGPGPATRRGRTSVHGLSQEAAATLLAARAEQPSRDLDDVDRRAGLNAKLLELLATAGALTSPDTTRQEATRQEATWREATWRAGAHAPHQQLVLPGLDTHSDGHDLMRG
jgi:error-prone DNA polymerase